VFYTASATGAPVRYWQHGRSIRNSHPTDYYFDIEEFGPRIDEAEFYVPPDCKGYSLPPGPSFGIRRKTTRYLDNNWQPENQTVCNVTTHLDQGSLPVNFTWRDVPHVVPRVRDQATCGSCWAQAAFESLSAQLSMKLGKRAEASVQQLVDCGWGSAVVDGNTIENNACDGGEGWLGYGLLANRTITIVSEEEYPYIGVSGYCPGAFTTSLSVNISRSTPCIQFKVPSHDTTHTLLKNAVYKYGPLMVSIHAGFDAFVALNSTNAYITNTTYCNVSTWGTDLVDHGVLLTGWRQSGGSSYLEIENSWSTTWGEDGFGYIDENTDCGIETMAIVPILDFS
jgi:C1A family cysteine protease